MRTVDVLEMLVQLDWWGGKHDLGSEVGTHSLAGPHNPLLQSPDFRLTLSLGCVCVF